MASPHTKTGAWDVEGLFDSLYQKESKLLSTRHSPCALLQRIEMAKSRHDREKHLEHDRHFLAYLDDKIDEAIAHERWQFFIDCKHFHHKRCIHILVNREWTIVGEHENVLLIEPRGVSHIQPCLNPTTKKRKRGKEEAEDSDDEDPVLIPEDSRDPVPVAEEDENTPSDSDEDLVPIPEADDGGEYIPSDDDDATEHKRFKANTDNE